MNIRYLSALLGVAAALSLHVQADPPTTATSGTLNVKTGTTSLTLDADFATGLNTAQVDFKKVHPGRIKPGKGELNFPLTGGAFDLADVQGEFINSGGFTLVQNTTTVTISDLIIATPASTDTTTVPTVTALVTVNGSLQGRVDLFSVDLTGLTAPFSLPHNKKVVLSNLPLKLTADGATALNTAFNVTTYVADTAVGTLTINAITGHGAL